MTSPVDPTPDRKSMKGWGRYLGDLDQPQTIQEAQLHATMAAADRLVELVEAIRDIQLRITRLELWIERNDPAYNQATPSVPYRPALNGAQEFPRHEPAEAI